MSGPDTRYPRYYNLLGVHPDADLVEIESAYQRQSAAAEIAGNAAAVRSLTAAYAVVGDPELRSAYDRQNAPMPSDELVEAVRPLAGAAVVFVFVGVGLWLLGVREIGSLLIGGYIGMGAWVTWRWTGRIRRLFAWFEWTWALAIALPCLAFGWMVGPILLVHPAVKLVRLGWPRLRERLGFRRRSR